MNTVEVGLFQNVFSSILKSRRDLSFCLHYKYGVPNAVHLLGHSTSPSF